MRPVLPIQHNTCPICGCKKLHIDAERIYNDDESGDAGAYQDWHCPDCGATGRAYYAIAFMNHEDVFDELGNPHKFYGQDDDGGERP